MQKNLPSVDTATYEALNSDVHMSIWKAADNAKLQNYLLELWNGPSTGHSIPETKVHYEKSTEEHILILKYIKDGNVEGARAEMRHHIMRSQENVLRALVS